MPFEFDGEKYRKASAHQKEWGQKIISEFTFKGDEHILDLGSGDGVLTTFLADLVPKGYVLGIDSSQGMIDTAKQQQKQNLQFKLIDINEINFAPEFDLIFSNATLHWIKNHSSLLNNVYRALKPDGKVRFNFAAEGNCSNFFRVVRDVMADEQFSHFFIDFEWPWYMPAAAQYEDLVCAILFREFRVWYENADRYFPDAAALTGWVDQPSIVPFLKCLDDAHKKQFRDIVVSRMIRETLQTDGTCFETFRRMNLLAVK
jgi:trans-aconitate 2-methyltransferase